MNIYRSEHIPKRLQNPEGLASEAWHFANTLAAGRWAQKGVNKVQVTRSIVERLGSERQLEDEEIQPIYNELMLSFSAFKRQVEDNYFLPFYTIGSTTSQDISSREIPTNVLGEIFEEASEEEEHPLYDLLTSADDEPEGLTADAIDTFDIQREQEVIYNFDHEGNIEDYTISYSYVMDDAKVHELEYTHSHSEVIWSPITLADGSVRERKPAVLLLLNEESIESEVKNVDTKFEEFLSMKDLREVMEFSAQPKEEHIRRLLGMISLLSGGFVDLRKR